ncbi:MAG: stage II sporulation protein M [Anaerolineae bacterium]
MAELAEVFRPVSKLVGGIKPALIITHREVKDTLRDWRIVLPILILVVGFPILANFVAARAINFVGRFGADIIIERLYPFLMLVVGFFPSTFSLVIALETFVGEKERSSLEPLLATPLTDLQLYVGKLLASVTPPVIASYIGMAAYLLGLGFTLGWWPPVDLLLLAVVLSTIKSVVMVAGAVIVSSQSTSVRAANLVASFIIVPMALLLQVEAGMLLYAHYDALWMVALALLVVATLLIRLGVRIFNREHLLGRDLDQLDLVKGVRTFWHALRPSGGPLKFYRREIPKLLGQIRAELWVTLLVVVVGGLSLGIWTARQFPLPPELFSFERIVDTETIQELVAETGLLPTFSPGAVLLNNVRALLFSAILGLLSLGTLALLLLMLPVAIIVYVSSQIGQVGVNPWLFIAVTVLPHGVLELPAAIIATAQAMRMGDVLLQPPREGGGVFGVLREVGHFLKIFLLFVVPLLAVAAWIEARITPQLLVWFLGQVR